MDSNPARYAFQAYHLTETLKLKDIDKIFGGTSLMQSATKLTYKESEGRYFFIYRFGSVIFFNIEQDHRNLILDKIKSLIGEKPELFTSEEFVVDVVTDEKESVGFERGLLNSVILEKIDLLALILAQSTALEYFEIKVEHLLRQTDDIGTGLKQRGRLPHRASAIKRFMGECITTKHDLVSSLYLLDKPDETWTSQSLDLLYREAVDMFEIRERYKTLDYKLRMIQENLELIAELLQYRNANTLEWAIIIPIAVEIVLFIFSMS